MHIIFGDIADQISGSYTILELDEFVLIPSQKTVKSYCVVEHIPLAEFARLDENKKIHQELIKQYRLRNWHFCRSAISVLLGCWNGEVDSFYKHLDQRLEQYIIDPPGESWNWAIVKGQQAELHCE